MTDYAPHELALVLPPITESEFAAFKEDMHEHGQHEPITLYEGKILDGLHAISRAAGPRPELPSPTPHHLAAGDGRRRDVQAEAAG